MRPESFAALILTNGRPDQVYTLRTLRKHGYTGPIVLVVDNEDRTADDYRALAKKEGVGFFVFDKAAVAKTIDDGDNFSDRRAILWARNACWEIAAKLGYRHFVQLDDDYVDFRHKRNLAGDYIDKADIKDLDAVFAALLDFFRATPALTVAIAQGGDFIGGRFARIRKPLRKAMNSFLCSVDRPFRFSGRLNEDVNTYTAVGSRGGLFLTVTLVALQQRQTQQTAGGMTDIYRDAGTYVKSFYSVMFQPSSVRVVAESTVHRIHHKIRWRYTVPVILSPEGR